MSSTGFIDADISYGTASVRTGAGTALSGQSILVYGMNFSPEFAGVGKYTGEIVEHLVKEGADVSVVTAPPHYPGWQVRAGFRNRFSSSRAPGLRVTRCPLLLRQRMRGIWRLVAPATFALTSAPLAIAEILWRRPKVVLLVEPTLLAAPVALGAARLVGARTVLHVQDLEVDAAFVIGHLANFRLLKRLGIAFERFCYRHMDSVITISNSMADRIVEKGVPRDRVSVVRNWVDLDHIHPLEDSNAYRRELGFADDDFIVLYAGNVGAKQGLGVLLGAAERLVGKERLKFVIAGEGPAKQDLVSRFGHLPNVRFLPFQPAERLNAFLNLADLHALPQDAGAADLVLPSKLGGMLASGRRIVVTADPETEMARFVEGAALVVEPGNAAVLADAIAQAARETDSDARRALAAEKAAGLGKKAALQTLIPMVVG